MEVSSEIGLVDLPAAQACLFHCIHYIATVNHSARTFLSQHTTGIRLSLSFRAQTF